MQRASMAGYNPRMARRKSDNHRCDVALLVDEETGERGKSGRFVPDRGGMERRVCDALRARYAQVAIVPFGSDVVATLMELRKLRPHIVFNLTEWVHGDRKLDHAIAALLDVMKIRYTGTGPIGMHLARDKALSKQIVAAAGVDVPLCFTLRRGDRIENPGVPFPLIVKPQFGDASEEISKASLVRTPLELRAQVKALRSRIDEPVVCEEFVPGRDIYVGLIGNEPRVLAPTEMVIASRQGSAPKFATFRLKNDGAYRTRWRVKYRLAQLPRSVRRRITEFSQKAFRALQLRDYARVDFRLADDGRLVFIEANPNPDLTPHNLGMHLCLGDVEYWRLIPQIVETARKRYRTR